MALSILSKLPNVGASIFSTMTSLANEHQAINLAQGFPDFACPQELVELVKRKMDAGFNQYAPMPGLLRLREVIAEKVEGLHGHYYDPQTEITVTAGATQAIFTAIAAVVRPGDEVIIVEPAYDSYAPAVKIMGGLVKSVETAPPSYRIDWQLLRRMITSQTKLIIVNTPHNPSGSILTDADMQELAQSVVGTDIMVLSDEVYEHVIYDGYTHLSAARYQDLRERTFVVASFGKLFHNTGWKVGYCLAPQRLMSEFRKIHQFMVFSVNTPMQYAITDFLQDENTYLQLSTFFQEKRNTFLRYMQGSRFKTLPCKGTYFVSMQFDHISELSDVEFAEKLIKQHGVASIPTSVFYTGNIDHKVLRFCFAKRDDTLEMAAEKLVKV